MTELQEFAGLGLRGFRGLRFQKPTVPQAKSAKVVVRDWAVVGVMVNKRSKHPQKWTSLG